MHKSECVMRRPGYRVAMNGHMRESSVGGPKLWSSFYYAYSAWQMFCHVSSQITPASLDILVASVFQDHWQSCQINNLQVRQSPLETVLSHQWVALSRMRSGAGSASARA